jgi:hypothetical protein
LSGFTAEQIKEVLPKIMGNLAKLEDNLEFMLQMGNQAFGLVVEPAFALAARRGADLLTGYADGDIVVIKRPGSTNLYQARILIVDPAGNRALIGYDRADGVPVTEWMSFDDLNKRNEFKIGQEVPILTDDGVSRGWIITRVTADGDYILKVPGIPSLEARATLAQLRDMSKIPQAIAVERQGAAFVISYVQDINTLTEEIRSRLLQTHPNIETEVVDRVIEIYIEDISNQLVEANIHRMMAMARAQGISFDQTLADYSELLYELSQEPIVQVPGPAPTPTVNLPAMVAPGLMAEFVARNGGRPLRTIAVSGTGVQNLATIMQQLQNLPGGEYVALYVANTEANMQEYNIIIDTAENLMATPHLIFAHAQWQFQFSFSYVPHRNLVIWSDIHLDPSLQGRNLAEPTFVNFINQLVQAFPGMQIATHATNPITEGWMRKWVGAETMTEEQYDAELRQFFQNAPIGNMMIGTIPSQHITIPTAPTTASQQVLQHMLANNMNNELRLIKMAVAADLVATAEIARAEQVDVTAADIEAFVQMYPGGIRPQFVQAIADAIGLTAPIQQQLIDAVPGVNRQMSPLYFKGLAAIDAQYDENKGLETPERYKNLKNIKVRVNAKRIIKVGDLHGHLDALQAHPRCCND